MGTGYTIKRLREREGLTQKELSDLTGLSAQMISHYETGHHEPGMSAFRTIINAMGYELIVRKKKETP